MLTFKDFCFKDDLLKEFDEVIQSFKSINESNIGDLSFSNIVMKNLDRISSPSVKSIMEVIARIAQQEGKSLKDIIKLFTSEGIKRVKDVVLKIMSSNEIKYMIDVVNRINSEKPTKIQSEEEFKKFLSDMESTRNEVWEKWRLAQEQSTDPNLRDIALSNKGKFTQGK